MQPLKSLARVPLVDSAKLRGGNGDYNRSRLCR